MVKMKTQNTFFLLNNTLLGETLVVQAWVFILQFTVTQYIFIDIRFLFFRVGFLTLFSDTLSLSLICFLLLQFSVVSFSLAVVVVLLNFFVFFLFSFFRVYIREYILSYSTLNESQINRCDMFTSLLFSVMGVITCTQSDCKSIWPWPHYSTLIFGENFPNSKRNVLCDY